MIRCVHKKKIGLVFPHLVTALCKQAKAPMGRSKLFLQLSNNLIWDFNARKFINFLKRNWDFYAQQSSDKSYLLDSKMDNSMDARCRADLCGLCTKTWLANAIDPTYKIKLTIRQQQNYWRGPRRGRRGQGVQIGLLLNLNYFFSDL